MVRQRSALLRAGVRDDDGGGAHRRGELMTKDAAVTKLNELGAPVPEFADPRTQTVAAGEDDLRLVTEFAVRRRRPLAVQHVVSRRIIRPQHLAVGAERHAADFIGVAAECPQQSSTRSLPEIDLAV